MHDIALILPFRDAQEISGRLQEKMHSRELVFERPIIVFEWLYDNDRNEYVLRKVAAQTSDFRDSGIPSILRLSSIFSARAASLKVSPDKIKNLKAMWQFCNDAPPPIYTLVFLWTKIFFHLLGANQREIWRRRDPRKQMPLDLTLQRLTDEIQTRYPIRWGRWTTWARDALEALVQAGLAKRVSEERYIVAYSNLTRELGVPGQLAAGAEIRSYPSEYAKNLATYICRGEVFGAKAESPPKGRESQTKLFTDEE